MTLMTPNRGVWGFARHAIDGTSPVGSQAPAFAWPGTSTLAYPTSDLAIYIPVRVKDRVTVVKVWAGVSSASGNIDVGVYDSAGARLLSTGAQAASAGFVYDTTDTVLGPGLHYLAIVADNTTVTFVAASGVTAPLPATWGVLTQQLGAGGTLPSTATWAVDQTLAGVPHIAMLLETTVA